MTNVIKSKRLNSHWLKEKSIRSICTPDDCQKHETHSSVPELFCCLIQPFFIFIYIHIYI